MEIVKSSALKSNIKESFLKEKIELKNMVYDEIENIEKGVIKNTTTCSVEMLQDIIFFIDKGFDDIVSNVTEFNIDEKKSKLVQFKKSLIYVLYGI